jgi:hypothetical protein
VIFRPRTSVRISATYRGDPVIDEKSIKTKKIYLVISDQLRTNNALVCALVLVAEEDFESNLANFSYRNQRDLRIWHDTLELVVFSDILPMEFEEVVCQAE